MVSLIYTKDNGKADLTGITLIADIAEQQKNISINK